MAVLASATGRSMHVGYHDQLGRRGGRGAFLVVSAPEAAEQEEERGADGDEDAEAEDRGTPRPAAGTLVILEIVVIGPARRRSGRRRRPRAAACRPRSAPASRGAATAAPTTAGAEMPAWSPDRKRPSASENAPAEPKRWAGSRASALRTMPSRRRVDIDPDRRWRRRVLGQAGHGHGAGRVASPDRSAREHLGKDEPEGVDVGRGRHVLAAGLLRAQVADAAERLAGQRQLRLGQGPRDAEVGDLHLAGHADQDVRGLDVAMDDAHARGPRPGRRRPASRCVPRRPRARNRDRAGSRPGPGRRRTP